MTAIMQHEDEMNILLFNIEETERKEQLSLRYHSMAVVIAVAAVGFVDLSKAANVCSQIASPNSSHLGSIS